MLHFPIKCFVGESGGDYVYRLVFSVRHPSSFVVFGMINVWVAYAIGFVLRPVVRANQDSLGLFVTMQLFIVTSPAAFIAFNYITFGRFLRTRVGDGYCFLRAEVVARVFILCDVTTFIIQVCTCIDKMLYMRGPSL